MTTGSRQRDPASAPREDSKRRRRRDRVPGGLGFRGVPDHLDYMTAGWRRRRSRITGLPEAQAGRSRGLRDRFGIRPYHRNPAHVLLAHPGVVATLVVALALVLRAVEVQQMAYTPIHDARSYMILGGDVASSGDYASDGHGAGGTRRGPSAYFAPGYPYLLGALDAVTGNPPLSASQVHVDRFAQAVLGTLVVGFVGLIALELFGVDLALLAMALAAIYPAMIELSSVLVAETLMVVFELAAVWSALRLRRSRDPLRWAAAAGVCAGLATLTHVNAILLVIPLGVAAAATTPVIGRRQMGGPAVVIVCTLLTLTPWLVRDELVMHRFVPITDEAGITLAGTYNATSPHSNPPYRWRYFREVPSLQGIARHASRMTEVQLDDKLQSSALTYIADHPSAPLGAFWHNSLRLLELAGSHAWKASAASIGLPLETAQIGVICFWVVGGLALLGLIAPPGLKAPGWLWLVPVLMWLSAALVNGETPRFRSAIDPFLILLAARGVARVADWIRPRPVAAATTGVVTRRWG